MLPLPLNNETPVHNNLMRLRAHGLTATDYTDNNIYFAIVACFHLIAEAEGATDDPQTLNERLQRIEKALMALLADTPFKNFPMIKALARAEAKRISDKNPTAVKLDARLASTKMACLALDVPLPGASVAKKEAVPVAGAPAPKTGPSLVDAPVRNATSTSAPNIAPATPATAAARPAPGTSPTPQAPAPASPSTTESLPPAMRQDMLAPVNATLEAATNGQFSDLNQLLSELQESKIARAKLQRELEAERAAPKSSIAPVILNEIGDQDTPKLLRIDMVRAREIFPYAEGNDPNLSMLDIEVPYFVWEGAHSKVPWKDPSYLFPSLQLVWTLRAMTDGRIPWLFGMPGTGKTTLPEQIAAWLNWPHERINCDKYMRRADIIGTLRPYEARGGGIGAKFVPGALVKALEGGCITVLDEISQGATELFSVFTRVMEGKGLLLLEDGGRTVTPHKYFRLIATCNTIGRGTGDSLFNNVNELSMATRDRVAQWIEFKHMPEEIEARVVHDVTARKLGQEGVPDKDFILKAVKLANEMRALWKTQQIDEMISLRALFAMAEDQARMFNYYPEAKTLSAHVVQMHVLNRCPDDVREVVRRKAEAVFGNIFS